MNDSPNIDALLAWSITDATPHILTGGAVNTHWRLVSGDRVYVLRRYNSRMPSEAIPFEHQVLRFTASRGWPVAAPLPSVTGDSLIQLDDGRYALFPYLSGAHPPHRDQNHLMTRGRLLARLHEDLAEWPAPGQRPAFGRVTDLDTYVRPDGFNSFSKLVARMRGHFPVLVGQLEVAHAENAELLKDMGFLSLPDTLVHFEYYAGNLLFDDHRLTGILDFDFVHLDSRVADIARSVGIDCALSDGQIDLDALRSFLLGYRSISMLTDLESTVLSRVILANALWLAALPLSMYARTEDETFLQYFVGSMRVQVPAVQRQISAIDAVVLGQTKH